jgi:hypothetical protein
VSVEDAWPAPLIPLPEPLAPPRSPSSTIDTPTTVGYTSKPLLDADEDDGPFSRAQEKLRSPKAVVSVIRPSENGGGTNFPNVRSRGSGGCLRYRRLPPHLPAQTGLALSYIQRSLGRLVCQVCELGYTYFYPHRYCRCDPRQPAQILLIPTHPPPNQLFPAWNLPVSFAGCACVHMLPNRKATLPLVRGGFVGWLGGA